MQQGENKKGVENWSPNECANQAKRNRGKEQVTNERFVSFLSSYGVIALANLGSELFIVYHFCMK